MFYNGWYMKSSGFLRANFRFTTDQYFTDCLLFKRLSRYFLYTLLGDRVFNMKCLVFIFYLRCFFIILVQYNIKKSIDGRRKNIAIPDANNEASFPPPKLPKASLYEKEATNTVII